jgi:hypothetical protein
MTIKFTKRKEDAKKQQRPSGDAFDRWYQAHKGTYNSSRKSRYHNDPLYRQKILDASREKRENRRKQNPKPADYTLTMAAAAEVIGVTIWTLRNWRSQKYFPEPLKYNSELWFSGRQVVYISYIKDFFDREKITRLSAVQKEKLGAIVQQIFANWD